MNVFVKALSVLPIVIRILNKIAAAAKSDSDGGKKITADEAAEIVSAELAPLVDGILKAAGVRD